MVDGLGKQVSAWLIHEVNRSEEARLSGLGARQVVLTRGEAAALCAYIAALEDFAGVEVAKALQQQETEPIGTFSYSGLHPWHEGKGEEKSDG